MVGVPGRSLGCKTCLQRKKKCDLQRPECNRCTERGLVCRGYDPGERIFIYQNPKNGTTSKRVDTQPPILDQERPRGEMASENSMQWTSRRPVTFDILLPTTLARSAYGEKSLEMYFDAYLPGEPASKAMIASLGLANVLPLLFSRNSVVRSALLATEAAMTGIRKSDRSLIERGKQLYGKSLQDFALALRSGVNAMDPSWIAVPRLMALFEVVCVSDPESSQQARGWESHLVGDLAFISAKRPHAFSDGIAHWLFQDGRLKLIVAAIMTRKATFLNSVEWKTLPWKTKTKSPRDSLIDTLACIPEILEDLDSLTCRGCGDSDDEVQRLLTKCWAVDAALVAWHASNQAMLFEVEDDTPVPITYPDTYTAHLTTTYDTVCLLIYRTILDIHTMYPTATSTLPQIDYVVSQKHPQKFARRIARSVPYFFNTETGFWGAVMIGFPMGSTIVHMKLSGVESDLEYTKMMYNTWSSSRLSTTIQSFLAGMHRAMSLRVKKEFGSSHMLA